MSNVPITNDTLSRAIVSALGVPIDLVTGVCIKGMGYEDIGSGEAVTVQVEFLITKETVSLISDHLQKYK